MTERTYRTALAGEGLLEGPADDLPLIEVLRAAIEKQLPIVTPPQMVSTVDDLRERIVVLAEKGLKPQAIYDRLRLEDPALTASFYAIRGALLQRSSELTHLCSSELTHLADPDRRDDLRCRS